MSTKRRKAFIVAGLSTFLSVAFVAYLITVSPFKFVLGSQFLWLTSIQPVPYQNLAYGPQ